jgi:hypothetical protein
MKTFIALAALLVTIASPAAPADARDAQAKAAVEQVAAGRRFQVESSTFGDLDGDGIDDFATFLGDPHGNDDDEESLQVLVFKGRADGGFDLLARSGAIRVHERVSQLLQIRRGSLYLHRDGSDGCCGRWSEDFQFKRRDGPLMLVGIEQGNYHPQGVDQPDEGASVNLATGQSEHWIGSGPHPKRRRHAVPGLKPVALDGFDYDKFTSDWPGL